MKTFNSAGKGLSCSAIALLSLMAGTAIAQDAQKDEAKAESPMEVIIITGTPGGRGINKMNASFAVTNLSGAEIEKASPKATSEVLTLVPGVWVESSGGVSGANIMVRGLPSGGDAPFVTMQLQGMPIFPPATLSFLENSTLFRVDETIRRVEALRGGPNPVFSNGQTGLTANFVLKEGRDKSEGLVKATFTDYGTKRVDAVYSGKLADDLYFMLGGYATSSPSPRDTQFDSEVGSQFTLNITKKMENGKLTLYTRATDDVGTWFLPFAINVPGIDLGKYVQLGNYSRFATLQVDPAGTKETFDLANGRGWKGSVSGVNFEHTFDSGWKLNNRFGFTSGNADTYGLVPDGSAVAANSVSTVIGGPVKTADGRTLGAGSYVQNWGAWVVKKNIRSITNDFSLSKAFGPHDLTFGYFAASFSSDDWWTLGNFKPMHVTANGNYLASNITCANLAAAGSGSGCWGYGINSAGDSKMDALYVADSFQLNEKLRLDIGVRHQKNHTSYVLDSGPGYANGTIDLVVDDDRSNTSWTLGGDYRLTQNMGVFGRMSVGYNVPNFDNFREGQLDTSKVNQYELGYKFSNGSFDLFATLFHNKFEGAKFSNVSNNTTEQNTNEATGLEIDGRYRTDFGLNLALNATLQDTEITNSSDPASVGKQTLRQPKFQMRFTPSYDWKVGNTEGQVFANISAIGDRFSDNGNLVKLKGYTKLDVGVNFDLGGVDVSFFVDNLTDETALTEGDPRTVLAANGRPIFGKTIKLSLGYKF